ncbi:hypothetical protein FSP39_005115 [Pinctada imbricata]|uniref:Mutator-like transposase domain-containing protein n=1 Tax=Pinctada imbricata TaxID=66713 RepID=A0AA88XUD5_PINIB|nr:hypothetical protein FSP39_005115 [Pinctada imbricata]
MAECTKEVNEHLNVSYLTSDGDSKAFAGLKSVQKGHCEPLKDIRHLSLSMKRQISNAPFSSTAFSGRNKSALQNRFASDVKARCVAELTEAVQPEVPEKSNAWNY